MTPNQLPFKCRRCGRGAADGCKNHGKSMCRQCYCIIFDRRNKNVPDREQLLEGGAFHEPTMEEVEALVAAQMANLPDWWNKEKGI